MGRTVVSGLALAVGVLVCAGCGDPVASSGPIPGGSETRTFPTAEILFDGPDDTVLVARGGEPFIDAGDYNHWVRSRPTQYAGADRADARRQAVRGMIRYRLLYARAEREGYREQAERDGRSPAADDVVMDYIRDHAANPALVADREAEAYLAEHGEPELQGLDRLPAEMRLDAIKLQILSDRLGAEIREEIQKSDITLADVLGASDGEAS